MDRYSVPPAGAEVIMTGATSFVGAAALKELLRAGCRVRAVVRPGSKNLDKLKIRDKILTDCLTVTECDLSDLERLPGEIPAGDIFLHFGWEGSGSGARSDILLQEVNLEYSIKAVQVAAALGCRRFLFSGSQAEYGFHRERITEETACAPASAYGWSKREVAVKARELCGQLGMDYGHLRIFSAYGPGDHPWSLAASAVRTFLTGGEMRLGACDQKWNFLYIEDLARAVARLALCGEALNTSGESGHIYNLAGAPEDTRVLREFVEEIYELCGRKGSRVYGVRPPNAEGVVSLDPDIEKVCRVTGWKPKVRFAEGIRRMIQAEDAILKKL